MIQIIINYHSAVDVITNSSTEIFCEITSADFLPIIQNGIESILGHPVYVFPDEEDRENYSDYAPRIQFEIRYGDSYELRNDFCALLENYLTNLVGQGNFKINRDVYM